jgi:branched-subunit amino acid ABC-type transport system permease component
METNAPRRSTNRIVLGVWLVLAGVLLLLDQFDVVYVGGVGHLWPLLLLGLGIGKMVVATDGRERRGAYWLVVIGLWFTLNQFTVYRARDTWPLVVLALGAKIIWDELGGRRNARTGSDVEDRHA